MSADPSMVSRLYLTGRYLKLRRDISQTPFVLRDGTVKAETSVESVLFEKLGQFVKGEGTKFIPAGREDMDVRMLGTGRPFAFEIKNPTTNTLHPYSPSLVSHSPPALCSQQLRDLGLATEDVSSGVLAREWQVAKRDAILTMKTGEEDMKKTYCALVWLPRGVSEDDIELLNGLKEVTVHQWTPLRVAHRRANAEREKTVHWMKAAAVPEHNQYLKLELCTSAGCYIKEFIHGDFGRTLPSMGELLQVEEAQCCALDVTHVALDLERAPEVDSPDTKKTRGEPEVTSDV